MSQPIELFQGTDRDIIVKHNDSTLPSADEIEAVIDTSPQIVKSLTGGGISGVSATQLTISVEDTDTVSKMPGEYTIELRSTDSNGKKTWGEIRPGYVVIIDSKFSNTA